MNKDSKKLENVVIALRKLKLTNNDELLIDFYTCLNHADNEHETTLEDLISDTEQLLNSRIRKDRETLGHY